MSEQDIPQTKSEQVIDQPAVAPATPSKPPTPSKPSIVRIVGTGDGIVMRIGDRGGRWQDIVRVLSDHLAKAEGFFQGERIAIEIGARSLTADDLQQIADVLASYTVAIWSVRTSNPETHKMVQEIGLAAEWAREGNEPQSDTDLNRGPARWEVHLGQKAQAPQIARPVEEFQSPQAISDSIVDQAVAGEGLDGTSPPRPSAEQNPDTDAPAADDDQTDADVEDDGEYDDDDELAGAEIILAPPYIHQGTLRSGQVFRHAGTVMVVGDVNPGAEVISGGDIFVWGKLRGIVHAGAMGNERSVVCAIDFEPIQLRIAGYIAMSPKAVTNEPGRWFWRQGTVEKPEVARVMGKQIVVDVWDRE